ncbi:MAG: DUF3566 domain-containing protein [Acidimicrobiales bacterium]
MAHDPHGMTRQVDVASSGDPTGSVTATVPPIDDGPGSRPPRPAWPEGEQPPLVTRRAPRRGRKHRAQRRGRRVKRIIRRIELWSVLKLVLVFYSCLYAVTMASLALLWGFANSAGLVDNFEGFMEEVGFENWQFYGEDMFRRTAAIGAILVLTGTLLTLLAAALVNVISELTGGIRVVVIEEDPREPTPALAPQPQEVATTRSSRRQARRQAARAAREPTPVGSHPLDASR